MSSLKASNCKNNHILAKIYLFFLEKRPRQNFMLSIPNFDISERIVKVVIKYNKF